MTQTTNAGSCRTSFCSIKFCGLTRPEDIRAANELMPDYIGFVFAPKSRRYVSPQKAADLKVALAPGIRTVGVFVNEAAETVTALLNDGLIHMAQLHGSEDGEYIKRLRGLTDRPLIQAFCIKTEADLAAARQSTADYILLDSGAGTGKTFDWRLIHGLQTLCFPAGTSPGSCAGASRCSPDGSKPCFLAGGLTPGNVGEALKLLSPYGVDVSSGIETDGVKDPDKMAAFVAAVRNSG